MTNNYQTESLKKMRLLINFILLGWIQLSILLLFGLVAYGLESFKFMILAAIQVFISIMFIFQQKSFVSIHYTAQLILLVYSLIIILIKIFGGISTSSFDIFQLVFCSGTNDLIIFVQIFYFSCVIQYLEFLTEKSEKKSEKTKIFQFV
ncbi:unnamed protein product [Caenorhabditis angaria]|uniref:Transmembrane protein n=1 Tax=Caenorhabditis angaria TaxID=860376 RepID=A0A9P1IFA8_9PELO|nr:unnamed protein product [Caenorhabditis angaria]